MFQPPSIILRESVKLYASDFGQLHNHMKLNVYDWILYRIQKEFSKFGIFQIWPCCMKNSENLSQYICSNVFYIHRRQVALIFKTY